MRFHQSWYRKYVLNLPPGQNPAARGELYGNMLRAEDGDRGFNFLSEAIYQRAIERLKQGRGAVEPYRLLNNMLSSQPMCFNLFAPLKETLELATKLIVALPGVPSGIQVSNVELNMRQKSRLT
jgi:hypothetical protein